MRFPTGTPHLQNAKLSFVNFDSILRDSKVERASKISGLITVLYPDATELLFLRQGEPVNAARFTRTDRSIIPISEAIDKAKKSPVGTVSIYEVADELLAMILATFNTKPAVEAVDAAETEPDTVLEKFASTKFTGFVELRRGVELSYVRFDGGKPVHGYFSGRPGDEVSEEILRKYLALRDPEGGSVKLDIYEVTPERIEQATPALISLFLKMMNAMIQEYGALVGPILAEKTLHSSRELAAKEFSLLTDFVIDKDLTVSGEPLASPDDLSRAFAAWTDILVDAFRAVLGDRAEEVFASATKDFRFALKSTTFSEHSKLATFLE